MNKGRLALVFCLSAAAGLRPAMAQGTSGNIAGVVSDTSGAVVPNATVTLQNPVSGFSQTAAADGAGHYSFSNLPFNRYHLTASAPGFQGSSTDVQVRTAQATEMNLQLAVGTAAQEITVEADDVLDAGATQSTTIDRDLFSKLPLVSTSSPLSSLVTLSTPGIASDSNGLFHPLGEHADTTFVIDGQPISDQVSRVFGNPPSPNIIQSVNVINGIPPAEFGDKTSLVVQTTTRSGLGAVHPTGTIGTSYGSFGTVAPFVAVGLGTAKLGSFLSLDVFRSGRFLDSPEAIAIHDKGNSENVFERLDAKPRDADALQLNLSFSRSWFQQPNQFDQVRQDQRGQIFSYNIAPSWTHIVNASSLFSVSPYIRQDNFHYYPSHNLFNDTPVALQQSRRLQNAGIKTDYSLTRGVNTIKVGAMFYHTFLQEGFGLGVTNAAFNSPCVDTNGNPVGDPALTSPSACTAAGDAANTAYNANLAPYDLSRGGRLYAFKGRTDVKQEALYAQDSLAFHNLQLLLGVRADNYNGISRRSLVQPRLGVSYDLKRTGTVLRLGYGKFFLTPYNENLIVSSSTGVGGLEGATFGAVPLKPAARDQYNAGFEQSLGRFAVVSAEYFWKYTDRDFDFNVVLNSPLAFPIQWRKSKIDGLGVKITVPEYRGFSAYSVLGHTRSRFFGPEVGGVLFNDPAITAASVFRIDHDQAFQQSTNARYQYKKGGYGGLTWRYESGEVASSAIRENLLGQGGLSPDQQVQIQLSCGSLQAMPGSPITQANCPNLSQLRSPLVRIPALGAENDDRNPPRIAPRTLFDGQLGWDNVLHQDRVHTNLALTATNLTNKYALYNFLSTFSGTHFVAPRSVTAQLSLTF